MPPNSLIDQVMATALDPSFMITLLASACTFFTLIAIALPYVGPDPMAKRLALAKRSRSELRARQLEMMQRKSRLRRNRRSRLQELVDRFNLREIFAGEELRTKLIQANWRSAHAVSIFAAARALLPLGGGAAMALYVFVLSESALQLSTQIALVFGAVVVGLYVPNFLMNKAIETRQRAVAEALPDALDLLLICVESGISIEAAFSMVAKEVGATAPELAHEFEITTAEMAYIPDRRSALENLALRTGLQQVKAFVTTVIQAEKYGTPLSNALRTAAQENRDIRMAAAEKKAASLPPKLTVPMVFFFLPPLFVIVLGPLIISYIRGDFG